MGLAGAIAGMGLLVFLFATGVFIAGITFLFLVYHIPKVGKYLSFSLAILISYMLYMSFLPNKQFYMDEFKKRTNIALPQPYFVKKEKSCPKFFGDCKYSAIVKISRNRYESFRRKINLKKLDSCNTPKMAMSVTYVVPTPLECWKLETNSSKILEIIAFPDSSGAIYSNIYFSFM